LGLESVKHLLSTSHLLDRKRRLTQCQSVLVSIGILVLLIVRFDPPHFGTSSTVHASFQSAQAQDKKQCFECDGIDWAPPTRAFESIPPSASSSHLNLLSYVRPQQELDGSYHNRPPPLG